MLGIPLIAVLLQIGWLIVRPKVVANTGDRLKAVWSETVPPTAPGFDLENEPIDPLNVPPTTPTRSSPEAER